MRLHLIYFGVPPKGAILCVIIYSPELDNCDLIGYREDLLWNGNHTHTEKTIGRSTLT